MDLHTFPPVCLPDQDQEFVGAEGLVYGWGAQEGDGTDPANVLQKAQVRPVGVIILYLVLQVPIVSLEKCRDVMNPLTVIQQSMLCAGGEGKAACKVSRTIPNPILTPTPRGTAEGPSPWTVSWRE